MASGVEEGKQKDEEEEEDEEEDTAAPEECEKVDILAAVVVERREVRNINDLPEELLLEIFLRLQTTTLLKVCYMSHNSIQLFLTYRRGLLPPCPQTS